MICKNCKKEEAMEGYPWCESCYVLIKQYGDKKYKDILYRIEHKEELKLYRKQYYQKNKSKILETARKYQEDNKDSLREYRRNYYKGYRKRKREELNKQLIELKEEIEKLKNIIRESVL